MLYLSLIFAPMVMIFAVFAIGIVGTLISHYKDLRAKKHKKLVVLSVIDGGKKELRWK